ncbi:AAA family ATPase [Microbacterium sp. CFBP 13617]|uniref:replicative DNA helicase n=1 Tax=Microbacterium sp. CFBP 13617 TaxID=2774035 RepID=UPI001782CA7D|nr:DnaB-like helicase C-terminal domain-containing protein [Microbacterium sp. CFBP 13617]MBD8218237.1 AAA family ATPase [Microbacterium sp. CFBP 13617]
MSEVSVPYDLAAERAVLGAAMLSTAVLDDVLSVVEPGDMYDPKHETVFAAIRRLHDSNAPTDVVAVVDDLLRAGDVKGTLDAAYVHELTSQVTTAANGGYYGDIVHQHAIRRRLLEVGTNIAHIASDTGIGALEAVELSREKVDAIGANAAVDVRQFGDYLASYVQGLDEKPKYVPTPWWEVNNHLGGLRAGGLYVVGARPGQGKSILGLQMALRLAKEGPVAFCSLEMSKDDIMSRWVAQLAQVSLHSLVNHEVSKTSWQNLAMVRSQIADTPLFVSTSDEVSTITQVRAFARSVARRAPKGQRLAGVVVDYLQLLTSGERVESRQIEVAGFSRALKLLAQSLGVPVIALSQLNRGSTTRKSNRPTLADLRESGAIEQDADAVILLHRDEQNSPSRLDLDIAKNRQGQQGRMSLQWEGTFSRVVSRAWSPSTLVDDNGGASTWQ